MSKLLAFQNTMVLISRITQLPLNLFLFAMMVGYPNRAGAAEGTANASPVAEPSTVPAATEAQANRVEGLVVKIVANVRRPDLSKPWGTQAGKDLSGSGVVIEGKRILTNAHLVLYAGQIQVQGNQSGNKISARVEMIAPGIDLAVLKLDDESFFDTRPPLARVNTMPAIKDVVMTYGFPTGGTGLSITKGIVSRIEYTNYNYPVSGLRVQIDAAINAGNSGGPSVVDDKMIGLAYSRLGASQNIGYIIPNEEIELFLQDIADGKYDGKPTLWGEMVTLENAALRSYLRLDPTNTGLLVQSIDNPAPSYPLKKWDVITKIGDTPVDNEGDIKIGENLRVHFGYLIPKLAKNGKVPMTVIRSGEELRLEVPVEYSRPMLIPFLSGTYPEYYIFGPMVFSVATEDLLAAITSGSSGGSGGGRSVCL